MIRDATICDALPVLTAARLVLRPLQPSDEALLELYTSDARLAEGTRSIPHPLPPGVTAQFIARATATPRQEDVWVMDGAGYDKASVLGLISLKPLDRQQSQIGYWVAPAFWNAGYASEAVACLIKANPHKARTLFAEVFQDNPASAHVLTNAGFDYLGDAEAYSVARRANVPTWTYIRRM
ncbi:MAG: GNAT family N-acetyltransferase [Alphaproteobacteria bacterium]|nr:GNAT family N-acetyltransferase [Alphaproteobacteria bacterium]